MVERIKSPQEKGYTIPVKRRKSAGVYSKAYAKSLEPVKGKIMVCFDNGKKSNWDAENTIHEPAGFNPIWQIELETLNDQKNG